MKKAPFLTLIFHDELGKLAKTILIRRKKLFDGAFLLLGAFSESAFFESAFLESAVSETYHLDSIKIEHTSNNSRTLQLQISQKNKDIICP